MKNVCVYVRRARAKEMGAFSEAPLPTNQSENEKLQKIKNWRQNIKSCNQVQQQHTTCSTENKRKKKQRRRRRRRRRRLALRAVLASAARCLALGKILEHTATKAAAAEEEKNCEKGLHSVPCSAQRIADEVKTDTRNTRVSMIT